MASVYDGFVSRHLNRRISRPVARLLSRTPATPNAVSVFSLFVAAGSCAAFVMGMPIAGGLLAQASSVADGVDGDLARLTGKHSAFGAFLDAILDRYADGLILVGLTFWAADGTTGVLPWLAGLAAVVGTNTVTYTRARIDEGHRNMFDRGITSLASRDVRLLIVLIGGVAGQGVATLLTLAVLTNAVVLFRLGYARVALKS